MGRDLRRPFRFLECLFYWILSYRHPSMHLYQVGAGEKIISDWMSNTEKDDFKDCSKSKTRILNTFEN